MTETRRSKNLIGLLAGLGATLALVSPAAAISPQVVMVGDAETSYLGEQGDQQGPGYEQFTVANLVANGEHYVVAVYMRSGDYPGEANWQGHCTSIKLNPNGPPEIVADGVQIGNDTGNRAYNHPFIASAGDKAVVVYGTNLNNQATVKTYAQGIGPMCELLGERVKISNDNNNNEGAPECDHNGNGYFTCGYLSTGNNDRSMAVGVMQHADGSVEKTWTKNVVNPSNIGRPAIKSFDENYSLFCAAQGDNRPPEDGVQCALLDAMTGDIMWKELIAASNPGEKRYMNQPSIGKLDYGRFAIEVLESNGQGKNNNVKGSNMSHVYVIEANMTGYQLKAHEMGHGSYQTHSSICAGEYGVGEDTERVFGIFGAPISGYGQPVLQLGRWSPTGGMSVDMDNEKWVVGWYGDAGYLANIYGQNPNTQGREFLRCIGDVQNPGFGLEDGFLPSVETFFVTPHAGRINGQEKNAGFLSFVPAKMAKELPPEPPVNAADTPTGEAGEGSAPGGLPGGTDPEAPGGEGPGSKTPGGGSDDFGATQGGCACSTPGTSSTGDSWPAALALFGLAAGIVSRRRRS